MHNQTHIKPSLTEAEPSKPASSNYKTRNQNAIKNITTNYKPHAKQCNLNIFTTTSTNIVGCCELLSEDVPPNQNTKLPPKELAACDHTCVNPNHSIPLMQTINPIFCSRMLSKLHSGDFDKKIVTSLTRARARPAGIHDRLLFDMENTTLKWGNEKKKEFPIHALAIAEAFGGSLEPMHKPGRDERHMTKFNQAIEKLDLVYQIADIPFGDALINEAPLVDYLNKIQRRSDVWKSGAVSPRMIQRIMASRGVNDSLVDKMEVRELVFGISEPEEISEVRRWVEECHKKDQQNCPTNLMSMDVECMKATHEDIEFIYNRKEYKGNDYRLSRNFQKGNHTNIPVKMMIGGQDWGLIISLPMEERRGSFHVPRLHIQDELIEFFESLPLFTGLGIEEDTLSLERLINSVNKTESFKFKGYVDLSVMAIAAGWNIPLVNMPILSYITTGGVLNKKVSCGDNNWGRNWTHIPTPLKAYCLADIKFGYQVSVIFYAIILYHLFPDPDITLSILRCSHEEFAIWFGGWLSATLFGCEADTRSMYTPGVPTSYRQLLKRTIVYRTDAGPTSSNVPRRIQLLIDIWSHSPSITKGGHRFIHKARLQIVKILAAFDHAKPNGWERICPNDIHILDPEKVEAAVFGISNVNSLDFNAPVAEPIKPFGLTVHPDLQPVSLASASPTRLSSVEVRAVAERGKRIIRETVLEWVRLNVANVVKIEIFMNMVHADPYYSLWTRSYYLESKNIYRRCTTANPPSIREDEWALKRRTEAAIRNEEAHIKGVDKEIGKIESEIEELLKQVEEKRKLIEERRQVKQDRIVRKEFLTKQLPSNQEPFPKMTWRGQMPGITGQERTHVKESRLDIRPDNCANLVGELQEFASSVPLYWQIEDNENRVLGHYPRVKKSSKRKPDFLKGPSQGQSLAKHWNPDPEVYDLDEELPFEEVRVVRMREDSNDSLNKSERLVRLA